MPVTIKGITYSDSQLADFKELCEDPEVNWTEKCKLFGLSSGSSTCLREHLKKLGWTMPPMKSRPKGLHQINLNLERQRDHHLKLSEEHKQRAAQLEREIAQRKVLVVKHGDQIEISGLQDEPFTVPVEDFRRFKRHGGIGQMGSIDL